MEGAKMNAKKPQQKKGILVHQAGDEWLFYDQEEKSVHVLNSTAEFIWRLCDGNHTLSDMEKQLHETFLVPKDSDIRTSVSAVLQNFADIGILETKDQ
jgi:hypothetical protein